MANKIQAKGPEKEIQENARSCEDEERIENVEVCAKCRGRCCRRAPCHYSPNDLDDLSYDGIKNFIMEKGYVSIIKIRQFDYYDEFIDQPFYYILRIRKIGAPVSVRMEKRGYGSPCMLLTPDGCKLPYEERPRGARMLVPDKNGRCKQKYDLEECIHSWRPYQKTLRKLYRHFRVKKIVQSILNFEKQT